MRLPRRAKPAFAREREQEREESMTHSWNRFDTQLGRRGDPFCKKPAEREAAAMFLGDEREG